MKFAYNILFIVIINLLILDAEALSCWDLATSGYNNSPKLQCCVEICKENWDDNPVAGNHGKMFSCVDGCLKIKEGKTTSQCQSDCNNVNTNKRIETQNGDCRISDYDSARCQDGCSFKLGTAVLSVLCFFSYLDCCFY